jgi:multiple antibiotic resistance protein
MVAGFLHAFVPLFVAVDVIGIVPMYLGLADRLERRERRHMLRRSLLVAAAVSVAFAVVGKAVFLFVGITVADFQIAGGLILLAIAGTDLLGTGQPVRAAADGDDVGIVPLGVPMIAGPAVITSVLVLVDLYGVGTTILALIANLAVCWLVLARADAISDVLGGTGARALSKVVSLLLAAIGVHWVRSGLA